MGYPGENNNLCSLQAFLIHYFELCSLFWTFVVSSVIFRIIYYLPGYNPFTLITHVLCWGLPLLLTLLPLSTGSYGHRDTEHGLGLCFLKDTFWIWFSFYLFYWLSVLISLALLIAIIYKLSAVYLMLQARFFHMTIISRCLLRLLWFPLIPLVLWFPSGIYETMVRYHRDHHGLSEAGGMMLMMGGLLTSMAYLLTHPAVFSSYWSSPLPKVSHNLSNETPQKSSSSSDSLSPQHSRGAVVMAEPGGATRTTSIGGGVRGQETPPPRLPLAVNSSDSQTMAMIMQRRSVQYTVDDEFMFSGPQFLNPETRRRLSLDDLQILDTLRVTNSAFHHRFSESLSPSSRFSRHKDSSDIDVSINYPDHTSSRGSSVDRGDLDSLFPENRISLRLQLLKSAINHSSDVEQHSFSSPTPLHHPSPSPQSQSLSAYSISPLMETLPHDVDHISGNDRPSLSSLRTESFSESLPSLP
jgi:hypothetical protein